MKAQSFNLGWSFFKEGHENNKKAVTLPHDAMLYENRKKDNPSGAACAYFAGGKYIYEKTIAADEGWRDKSVILEFEGVYQKAVVYINENKVCSNIYGYSNFFVPINDEIILGKENTIKVVADNSDMPNSRWYSGSGIYRNVKLYVGNKKHIVPDSVFVKAEADGRTLIKGEVTGGETVKLCISKDGTLVVDTLSRVTDGKFEAEIQVDNPSLWDEDTPTLYDLSIELFEDEQSLDETSLTFGFRTISWDNANGLTVNGKKVLLRGSCIHHDNGILGAAAIDEAEDRKIRIHKEAGFNAIRSAHNPCSKAILNACDKYGVYVMDEFADHWLIHKNPYDYANEEFKANWEKDLLAMIRKDFSHPSVIMYSIGNEISELGLDSGVNMAKELAEYVKKIDPTRCVTAGINLMLATMAAKGKGLYGKEDGNNAGNQSMDNMPTSSFFNMLMNHMGDIMDKMASGKDADKVTARLEGILDINGYNYATSRYISEGKKYPGRVIVGSETLPRSIYKNWKLCEKLPYLIGDFVWTGWDYLGESGIGTVKYKSEMDAGDLIISGGPGLIDICGKMRPEMQWNRMIWHMTDIPEISVEPMSHAGEKNSISMWRDNDGVASWTWPGCEGKRNKVRVYATGAYVELLVNGKSLGRKKTKEYKADFKNIMYVPGTITAKSYDTENRLIGEKELLTDEGETRIMLTPSKTKLVANGEDICFVDIDLVGDKNITKSSSDEVLRIKVDGEGELIAFGSARPAPKESFIGNTHSTYLGKAQAVIRSGQQPSKITISVSSVNRTEKLVIDCQ